MKPAGRIAGWVGPFVLVDGLIAGAIGAFFAYKWITEDEEDVYGPCSRGTGTCLKGGETLNMMFALVLGGLGIAAVLAGLWLIRHQRVRAARDRELIERGRVDLVQPDVTRCGGITEWLRIAELAREHGVETVPHAWKSGIIKAASLQCNAVIPDALFQEYCVADTPINQTLTKERLPVEPDGTILVPTAPGIGITLDEEVVDHYRVD
jgi:hypothetical protein